MAREPQRREQPAPLVAAIVPVQRALIARAKAIEATLDELADDVVVTPEARALRMIAGVLSGVAEELAYW